MATYGIYGTPGQVAFTGYTNTLGAGPANSASTSGYAQNNGLFQHDDKIAKVLRNGGGSLYMKAVWYALMGAAAGGTASVNKVQVRAQNGSNVGSPVIETVSLINRATTAADLTAFQALMNRNVNPATYPPDLSGNGGGGHVAY